MTIYDNEDIEKVKSIMADANYFQRHTSKHYMQAWLSDKDEDTFIVNLIFTHKNRYTSLKTSILVTKNALNISFGKQYITGKRRVTEEIQSYFSSEVDLIIEYFEQKYCVTKVDKIDKIVYDLEDN